MAEVWQLLLSLLAVAALVLLVQRLRLGGGTALRDEACARNAAEMAVDGFNAAQVGISTDGAAAILMDDEGRILLLRQHGSHTAGRMLDALAIGTAKDNVLEITTSDRRFGPVTLTLPDARSWKARIDALKQRGHA